MEPAFEALYYLADFLPRRYPSMFSRTQEGIENLVTGDKWDLRRESKVWELWHPLQIMGLLTTEDWFIMQTDEDGETTRLTAGAPCFPAGWKIRERIGLSLWQIHANKVPFYEQKLSKAMDRFFLKIPVDKPIMRFNYAIDLSGELFHIHSHHNLTMETLERPLTVDQLHLRVERQFLQRLPKTKAIVFSIRTYVTPIVEVTTDQDVARALRTSVRSYSPEVAKYKNKHIWNDVLEAHLQEVVPETNLQ
jgi:dimethylamine monooxygenase subunit A